MIKGRNFLFQPLVSLTLRIKGRVSASFLPSSLPWQPQVRPSDLLPIWDFSPKEPFWSSTHKTQMGTQALRRLGTLQAQGRILFSPHFF